MTATTAASVAVNRPAIMPPMMMTTVIMAGTPLSSTFSASFTGSLSSRG